MVIAFLHRNAANSIAHIRRKKTNNKLFFTVDCREACRDPDNLNWLARSMVDLLTLIRRAGHEFESPAGQNFAQVTKSEDLVSGLLHW